MKGGRCNEVNLWKQTCTQVNIGFKYTKSLKWAHEGEPIKLQGFIFTGEIKDSPGGLVLVDLPEVFDADSTGMFIDDPDSGIVFLQISATDTNLTAGKYPYEIIVTDPGGDAEIFLRGSIEFYTEDF